MSARPFSLGALVLTGTALLALWAASFALSFITLGAAALPVALAIALVKAMLVALVFMDLAREALSIRATVVSAVVLALVLGGLMAADVATR